MGKKVSPTPSREQSQATLLAKTKRELALHAQTVQAAEVALRKVSGILDGAKDAESIDNLRHRTRSVLGHRKALRTAFAAVVGVLASLASADFELG